MILEKEDWEEPECCFRPHIAAAEAVHTGSADGGPSVREVIQGFDRLLDRDAKREAAIYLEDWLARYEEAGDWTSQITILNEMMGFYRNSGEREKGLAAVEKGLALVGDHGLSQTVTGGTTLPTLTVLMSLDMNWLVVLYCLVLFLCMISSGVVVVFGFINRFENAKYLSFMKNTQLRRGAIATTIMAVSMFISFAGLTNIVKYGYGYCGYWAIVFVIVPLLTVGAYKNRRFLKGLPDERTRRR